MREAKGYCADDSNGADGDYVVMFRLTWRRLMGDPVIALTTFTSYGEVGRQRQAEILKGLANPQQVLQSNADEIAEAVIRKLRDAGAETQVG